MNACMFNNTNRVIRLQILFYTILHNSQHSKVTVYARLKGIHFIAHQHGI